MCIIVNSIYRRFALCCIAVHLYENFAFHETKNVSTKQDLINYTKSP